LQFSCSSGGLPNLHPTPYTLHPAPNNSQLTHSLLGLPRAFTSLDGIGKGLDTDYDLTKLTVPYLRNLSTIKYGSESRALAIGFAEKTGLNNKDFLSTLKAPKNMQYVTNTLEKMEQGELKIRVRSLELEKTLERIALAPPQPQPCRSESRARRALPA
jgi:hypothetical protein